MVAVICRANGRVANAGSMVNVAPVSAVTVMFMVMPVMANA